MNMESDKKYKTHHNNQIEQIYFNLAEPQRLWIFYCYLLLCCARRVVPSPAMISSPGRLEFLASCNLAREVLLLGSRAFFLMLARVL